MATDARIGTTIAGYRIVSVLGRGGMGVVYLAEQVALGRKVALKVLAPELADDPKFRDRFLRESRVAASLEDPNILPVHEAGESDGALFIAMRYVRGTDLRRLIDEHGPLDPRRAASIVAQVASALDAAHGEGLVHRDVKPANVLLVPGIPDKVYLADFGLTKRATSDSGVTGTGQFVGTLDYAAPEQFTGETLTPATDVYSLGCVLYESLTGEPPFPRDREAAVLHAHLNSPPPKPSEKRPGLRPAVDTVVAKAMAKKPGDRFATAGALAGAAREALGAAGERNRDDSRRGRFGLGAVLAMGSTLAVVVALALVLTTRGGGAGGPSAAGSPSTAASGHGRTPPPFTSGMLAIDPANGAVVRRIQAPGGFRLTGVSPRIVAGEGAVWTHATSDVLRIDPATGKTTVLSVGELTWDVAVGRGAIWVTAGTELVRVDPATDRIDDRISVGGADLGITATPFVVAAPETVWVIGRGGRILAVDPGSDEPGKGRQVASSIGGAAYGNDALWVLNDLGGQVLRLDPATGAKLGAFRVSGNPVDIAVGFGSVWVLDQSGTITRFDLGSGAPTGTVRVGAGPVTVSIGLGSVWVANRGDGTISRIDPITNESTTLRVGAPVADLAPDPVTHLVWAVAAPAA